MTNTATCTVCPLRLSFLDRGMVYAIAHIRGGGEMGRPWYEDSGKYLTKRNTFQGGNMYWSRDINSIHSRGAGLSIWTIHAQSSSPSATRSKVGWSLGWEVKYREHMLECRGSRKVVVVGYNVGLPRKRRVTAQARKRKFVVGVEDACMCWQAAAASEASNALSSSARM